MWRCVTWLSSPGLTCLKHATSHNRKTPVISRNTQATIRHFPAETESFGASLGEFGLDDSYESTSNDISLHSANEAGEIEDASIRFSVDNLPKPDNLEAAAEKMAKAELATEIPGTPNETYLCTMCNTKGDNKHSNIIHLHAFEVLHAGMLYFKCKYCPKTFQGRFKLNHHMNTHSHDGSNVTPPTGTSTITTSALATPPEHATSTMIADEKSSSTVPCVPRCSQTNQPYRNTWRCTWSRMLKPSFPNTAWSNWEDKLHYSFSMRKTNGL